MNKQTMIKNYRRFSGADKYMIPFDYKKKMYLAILNEIPPRFMVINTASSSHGGYQQLRMSLKNEHKEWLIAHGAQCIGVPADRAKYEHISNNNGEQCEALIFDSLNRLNEYEPNKIGFWHCGDINIDGIEYQIKFQNAQICTENTLKALQLFARHHITPPAELRAYWKKKYFGAVA